MDSLEIRGPIIYQPSRASRRQLLSEFLVVFKRFFDPVCPEWFSSPAAHLGGTTDALDLEISYAPWLRRMLLDWVLLRSARRRVREVCRTEGFLLDRSAILKPGVVHSDDHQRNVRVLTAHAHRAERVVAASADATPRLCSFAATVGLFHFDVVSRHGCNWQRPRGLGLEAEPE